MKILNVVIAISRDKNNRLLFQYRKRDPYLGYLGLVGGKIEIGETLEKSLVREVKEETNLSVIKSSYLGKIREKLLSNESTTEVDLHLFNITTIGEVIAGDEGNIHWIEEELFLKNKHDFIPTDWLIVNSHINKKQLIKQIIVEYHEGTYEIESKN